MKIDLYTKIVLTVIAACLIALVLGVRVPGQYQRPTSAVTLEEASREVQSVPSVGVAPTEDIIVYVTRTGAKYHRAGCRYLSKSQIPISLNEARARYSPCSVCGPPT